MADWVTISSLATAGGTLVLAAATFASVKSANRAARIAEQSFQIGLRPVLVPSRQQDPPEEIGFVDAMFTVDAGSALVKEKNGIYYLGIPMRNVGGGLAVLIGWHLFTEAVRAGTPHADPDDMRLNSRDLYVPAGDTGFWQGAIREPDDPLRDAVRHAIEAHGRMALDVMYSDHEGGQTTITRLGLMPEREGGWRASVVRHWILERE
jgi:hypothetical protein